MINLSPKIITFPQNVTIFPQLVNISPEIILILQNMLIDAFFIDCREPYYALLVAKSTSVPGLRSGEGGEANFGNAMI